MTDIRNKKISIIGAARSGVAAALLAKKLGALPFLSDNGFNPSQEKFLSESGINAELGGHTDKIYDCDIFITSPGVPDNSEVLINAKQRGIEIISEIEFASWFINSPVIAITGTNGKSTTTALTDFILRSAGLNSVAAGNIGDALSSFVLNVPEDTIFVLEISSFQIDHIKTFKPDIATILNITPDHLDRYNDNFQDYINSKFNLLKNMSYPDHFLLNSDEPLLRSNLPDTDIVIWNFSVKDKVDNGAFLSNGVIYTALNGIEKKVMDSSKMFIKGEHNISNSLVGILTAKYFNIPNSEIAKALREFKGLEHRCEVVRVLDGVTYINDSKATNVNSTYFALKSYNSPIILILGGREHDNDYNLIKDLVMKNVKAIVAMGETKNKIYDFFSPLKETYLADTFEQVINKCRELAKPSDIVLFSPACKSFDMFNNYVHRGNEFKRIVGELK